MTTILAIDTSTDRTAVAIVRDVQVLVELSHLDPVGHGEALPKLVAKALEIESDIDLVAIGMGPGPFSGLRVGIAFGQSFALAREIPWVGCCSLDAIAFGHSEEEFTVAIEARRKEYFYAHYKNGVRVGAPQVALKAIIEETPKLLIKDEYPSAPAIAALAIVELVESPIYVRRPDAYPAPIGVTIRAMHAMDVSAVAIMEAKIYAGEDPWSTAQFKEELVSDHYYLVAEFENQVIAYAGVMVAGDVTDILTLTVSPLHRRKGIARELLKRLIDWSRSRGVVAVMLEVREGNEVAHPLYVANGFRPISKRENYYGPGLTAVVMRKDLK